MNTAADKLIGSSANCDSKILGKNVTVEMNMKGINSRLNLLAQNDRGVRL